MIMPMLDFSELVYVFSCYFVLARRWIDNGGHESGSRAVNTMLEWQAYSEVECEVTREIRMINRIVIATAEGRIDGFHAGVHT